MVFLFINIYGIGIIKLKQYYIRCENDFSNFIFLLICIHKKISVYNDVNDG